MYHILHDWEGVSCPTRHPKVLTSLPIMASNLPLSTKVLHYTTLHHICTHVVRVCSWCIFVSVSKQTKEQKKNWLAVETVLPELSMEFIINQGSNCLTVLVLHYVMCACTCVGMQVCMCMCMCVCLCVRACVCACTHYTHFACTHMHIQHTQHLQNVVV